MSVLIGVEIAKIFDNSALGKAFSFGSILILTWVIVLDQFFEVKGTKK